MCHSCLESQVEDRVKQLGFDESIIPLVLKELQLQEAESLKEAKAVGTAKGKPDAEKQIQIATAQTSKRFVSSLRGHSRAAKKTLDRKINALEKHLHSLYRKYKNKDITFRRFSSGSRVALKGMAELAFQLGTKSAGIVSPTGALRPLTDHERKWLDSYLKEELRYFNRFLDAVKASQSDKRSLTRLSHYSQAVRSVFESGRVLSVGTDVIIHWVLESKNPCPDCRLLHRHSPYTSDTLPTVPKGGQTRCRNFCYCSLRIVKSTPEQVQKLRKRKKSARWYLEKLKQNQKRKRR